VQLPVELVKVDEGRQKYVSISVGIEGEEQRSVIVRGNRFAAYHIDAAKDTMEMLEALGVNACITGGGRIVLNSDVREISIYGYSMQFGRAEHETTAKLLREAYPGFTVEWSNDGY
jgi:phosphohistidine phosphatase